jgi:putative membrane protein
VEELNNIERNHRFKIIYDIFKGGPQNLVTLLLFFSIGVKNLGFPLALSIALVIVLFVLGISILNWWKTLFSVGNRSIYYQKGILNVERKEILFEKINTVDMAESIMDRIFKTATIKIDAGISGTQGSEIKLVLSKARAKEIREALLQRESASELEKLEQLNKKVIKIAEKDLFLYSIISNSVFQGLGIIFVALQFLDDILENFMKIDTSGIGHRFDAASNIYRVLIIVGSVIFLLLLGTLFSIIVNFIKYYDFKLEPESDKLNIGYGVVNKKSYSFDRKKISGIHMKQNILMRLTGFITLEVESIGYGDEKGEQAILYPVLRVKEVDAVLYKLLPEFVFEGKEKQCPRKAFFGFFMLKLVFWIIVTTALVLINIKFILIGLILLIFLMLTALLQFKNTALGLQHNVVYLSYGIFTKKQSLLKVKAIQSLTVSQNIFQRRSNLCSFKINIYSNLFGKEFKVKGLRHHEELFMNGVLS